MPSRATHTGETPKPVFAVDLLLAQRFGYSGTNPELQVYQGFAEPGTNTGSPAWAIRKFVYSGTVQTATTWVSGTTGFGQFDKVWDDREGYTYQ